MQLLNAFSEFQNEVPKGEEFEHSEMLLYQAMILEDAGKFQESLDLLEGRRDELKDPLGLKETKARLYAKLGNKSEAESAYRQEISLKSEMSTIILTQ